MTYSLHRAIRKYLLPCPYCEDFDSAVSIGDFFPCGLSEVPYIKKFRFRECLSFPAAFYNIYYARILIKATMSGSPAPNERPMAEATSAAQHGDNIAHALAGAGGGLLSMTLT